MISFLNIDNIDTAKYGHLIIVIIRVEYSWTLWLIWNLNEYGKSMVFHPNMEYNFRNNRRVIFIPTAKL
jgi:hypothetical protein